MLVPLTPLDETATDIVEVKSENQTVNYDAAIYDLQGRRLPRLQRGLNIVDGRKVFVR